MSKNSSKELLERSHITYYSLIILTASALKGLVHVFAGRVKIVCLFIFEETNCKSSFMITFYIPH